MKRISTVSKPRVVEAYISQGIFLTILEVILNRQLAELSNKEGKSQS